MIPRDSTRALITLLQRSGADLTVSWAETGRRFAMDEVERARDWLALAQRHRVR